MGPQSRLEADDSGHRLQRPINEEQATDSFTSPSSKLNHDRRYTLSRAAIVSATARK